MHNTGKGIHLRSPLHQPAPKAPAGKESPNLFLMQHRAGRELYPLPNSPPNGLFSGGSNEELSRGFGLR